MTTDTAIRWGVSRNGYAHSFGGSADPQAVTHSGDETWSETRSNYAACGAVLTRPIESPIGHRFCGRCEQIGAQNWVLSHEDDPDQYDQAVMTDKAPQERTAGNTPQRTIRVPDDEWNAAKAAVELNGETISDVVRAALKRYAEERKLAGWTIGRTG